MFLTASMRPRRVRLGWSPDERDRLAKLEQASMRPRRVRLGWRWREGGGDGEARRFNEAEARAPRMGFGECKLAECALAASMRPRRVRLGWSSSERSGTAAGSLQ